jgi:hypothetical protein
MAHDEVTAAIERLIADAVADEAAAERSQARTLRQVAEEEATFVGIAVNAAERGGEMAVRTTTGRLHRGTIVAVGRDFLCIRDSARATAFLPFDALASLRLQVGDGAPDSAGARPGPLALSFAAMLARLAADRPHIAIMSVGDEQTSHGELRSVGQDVVTLQLGGDLGIVAYIRIDSITEVLLAA